MSPEQVEPLVLEDPHSGERIELRRLERGGDVFLELRVSLPPGRQGPPLHVHFAEDEEGTVTSGVLSAEVGGDIVHIGAGESVTLPRGVPHRWWNEGSAPLEFVAYAKPVVDLDRYLQAVFQILSSSATGRPSPIYMAHVMRRHRATQRVFLLPGPIQDLVFGLAYLLGTLLGKYRGEEWPGAPARCTGAPTVVSEEA